MGKAFLKTSKRPSLFGRDRREVIKNIFLSIPKIKKTRPIYRPGIEWYYLIVLTFPYEY